MGWADMALRLGLRCADGQAGEGGVRRGGGRGRWVGKSRHCAMLFWRRDAMGRSKKLDEVLFIPQSRQMALELRKAVQTISKVRTEDTVFLLP